MELITNKVIEDTWDLFFDENVCMVNIEKPMAFVLGGQSGSGKSELTSRIWEKLNGNCMVINGDEFRKLHPDYEKFQNEDIEKSPLKTSEFSGKLTEELINKSIKIRCNIIIEGTFRTTQTPIKTLQLLKDNLYYTNVFIKSTPSKDSWGNCISRYEEMFSKNPKQARYTPKEIHDEIVEKLAKNVCDVYYSGVVDNLEVYTDVNKIFDSKTDSLADLQTIINDGLYKTNIIEINSLNLESTLSIEESKELIKEHQQEPKNKPKRNR